MIPADKLLDFYNQLAPIYDCILTGSLGLYVQGIDLGRPFNDLDVIVSKYIKEDVGYQIASDIPVKGYGFLPHDPNKYRLYFMNLEKLEDLDLFAKTSDQLSIEADFNIDPTIRYNEVLFREHKYKVMPYWEIIKAKCEYASHEVASAYKHRTDLENILFR